MRYFQIGLRVSQTHQTNEEPPRARDRDRDILTRLRLGHQRPVNRGCPDEKYQYVNNNRLTEYPGTPAWTPATSKSRVSNERKKSYFFPFFHLFAK